MLLKIKRSQREGGVFGGKIIFVLDIRADYAEEERANINKYKLGGEVVYNSEASKKHLANAGTAIDGSAGGLAKGLWSMALSGMNLNITIASLQKGHHVECKDMGELLEAEEVLRTACKNLTSWLDAAASFDGRELIVEYQGGEERVQAPRALAAG
jgi:hypothetical protein